MRHLSFTKLHAGGIEDGALSDSRRRGDNLSLMGLWPAFARRFVMIRNQSTHLWLAQFAERLLEHFPEMNPLLAVKRAIALYPEFEHLDAISAADRFAAAPNDPDEVGMCRQHLLQPTSSARPAPNIA